MEQKDDTLRFMYDGGYRWSDIQRCFGVSERAAKLVEGLIKDGVNPDSFRDAIYADEELFNKVEGLDGSYFFFIRSMLQDFDRVELLYMSMKTMEEYYSGAAVDKPSIFEIERDKFVKYPILSELLKQYGKEDIDAYYMQHPEMEFIVEYLTFDTADADRALCYEFSDRDSVVEEDLKTGSMVYTPFGRFIITRYDKFLVYEYIDDQGRETSTNPFTKHAAKYSQFCTDGKHEELLKRLSDLKANTINEETRLSNSTNGYSNEMLSALGAAIHNALYGRV